MTALALFDVRILTVLALTLLTACGGGGGEEEDEDSPTGPGWSAPPSPANALANGATVTGVFRDSAVRGLGYESGTLSGVTGADGKFQFVMGSDVTFRIGAVTLGSFPGQLFMTPMNLPTGTTGIGDQIDNRSRFLQMLDFDGNPDNGIEISDGVRVRAASWPQVDFTVAPANLAGELAVIIPDAQSVDGTSHTLPSADAARGHFARTVWCTYSGIYRGTYTGSGDNGVFAIVSYGSGMMRGLGYSAIDHEGFLLEKTTQQVLSITPDFTAGEGSNGASFSGEYRTPNEIRGNWQNGTSSGTFVGARSGGSDTALYRISGFRFPVGTALIMSFEIDAANQVTGSIVDLDDERDGVPITLTGSLIGTTFTASSTGSQYSITNGVFNTAAAPGSHSLTGTLRDNVKGRDVSLGIPGCRLN